MPLAMLIGTLYAMKTLAGGRQVLGFYSPLGMMVGQKHFITSPALCLLTSLHPPIQGVRILLIPFFR